MKALVILFVSCFSLFAGERLVPLKSGQTQLVSYSLSCIVSDSSVAANLPAISDLVLTIRNIGAKCIDIDKVTATNFSLQDAELRPMKFYLRTPRPQNEAWGEVAVFHLSVFNAKMAPQPWTMHFNSDGVIPVELTMTNILPRLN